jgi:hypothetical protein
MDPRQRASQSHGQLHANLQHTEANYSNTNTFVYPDQNPIQPQNDFQNFFNADADPAFPNTWDNSSMGIDPAIQHSAQYQPPSSHWQHQQQQNHNLQPAGYDNAFARPQNGYGYQAYGSHSPYQNFTPTSYDPSLAYNSHNNLMNNNQFANPQSAFQTTDRTRVAGTVTPAALDSYPDPYGTFNHHPEEPNAQPTPTTSIQSSVHKQRGENFYDENLEKSLAASIPVGEPRGTFLVKNPQDLAKKIKTQHVAPYVHVGTERVESDETRPVYPRMVVRQSAKDIKRAVLQEQAGRSWTQAQLPILKKLKITTGAPKSVRVQSTGVIRTETASSDSSSEESSDDDEDSEFEFEEPAEPSPLPAARPSDPTKALEYDTIKTVWARSSSVLSGENIRTALGSYWELARKIRDRFRAAKDETKQAEAMKDEKRAARSKVQANEQRKMMETMLAATLKHGHTDIVERLGMNEALVAMFYSFLADRFTAADYNAPLVRDSVKLMCRCTTIDQDLFVKTKLEKVVPKLVKKCEGETKSYAEELLRKVGKNTAQKAVDSKPKEEAVASPLKTGLKANGTNNVVAGVKRPSSNDFASLQSAKKQTSSVGPKVGAVAKPANGNVSKAAVTSKAAALPPKVKHVVPKTSSLLAGLQSASKKPGTSIGVQKTLQAPDVKARLVTAHSRRLDHVRMLTCY